jgi:hypothetical protein
MPRGKDAERASRRTVVVIAIPEIGIDLLAISANGRPAVCKVIEDVRHALGALELD